jgi:hypothetical protein
MQRAKLIKVSDMEASALHIAKAVMAIAMALTRTLHTATCIRMVHHIFLGHEVCSQPQKA